MISSAIPFLYGPYKQKHCIDEQISSEAVHVFAMATYGNETQSSSLSAQISNSVNFINKNATYICSMEAQDYYINQS